MRTIPTIILIALAATSCTSTKEFEKSIYSYLESSNMDEEQLRSIQIKGVGRVKRITVADSISFITQNIEAKRERWISYHKDRIKEYSRRIEESKKGDVVKRVMSSTYKVWIEDSKQEVARWKQWSPNRISQYDTLPSEMILCYLVECWYTYHSSSSISPKEGYGIFVVSSDKNFCQKQLMDASISAIQ